MKIKRVDLWYPRIERERTDAEPQAVQIQLMDVRAANCIRVEYDFERDGYRISMPTIDEWAPDDTVMDEGWKEVAFVPAWATETPEAP